MTAKYRGILSHSPGYPGVESYDFERAEMAKIGANLFVAGEDPTTVPDEILRSADALLMRGWYISRELIEKMEACKVIAVYGVGVDSIDMEAATEHGIVVANAPYTAVEDVSNHAIALILACSRKLVVLDRAVRQHRYGWEPAQPLYTMQGRVLGLVSFGNIARAVAVKMKAFGVEILAYDPYVGREVADRYGVKMVGLEELLKASDYVSAHTPLTPETRHMLGEKELRLMKPTAILVNTGRGGVVDQAALYRALTEGWISAAGLDVLERKPPEADDPLLSLENVIFTGHTAGYSEEGFQATKQVVCTAVARVLHGQWPQWVVNPDVKPKVELRRC